MKKVGRVLRRGPFLSKGLEFCRCGIDPIWIALVIQDGVAEGREVVEDGGGSRLTVAVGEIGLVVTVAAHARSSSSARVIGA